MDIVPDGHFDIEINNQIMKYKINKGFIVQKLDDKTVIFDGEESVLYTFNETASLIFQKLKKGFDQEEILKKLIKKYGVKEEKARKDFEEMVKELIKKKIVTGNRKIVRENGNKK